MRQPNYIMRFLVHQPIIKYFLYLSWRKESRARLRLRLIVKLSVLLSTVHWAPFSTTTTKQPAVPEVCDGITLYTPGLPLCSVKAQLHLKTKPAAVCLSTNITSINAVLLYNISSCNKRIDSLFKFVLSDITKKKWFGLVWFGFFL